MVEGLVEAGGDVAEGAPEGLPDPAHQPVRRVVHDPVVDSGEEPRQEQEHGRPGEEADEDERKHRPPRILLQPLALALDPVARLVIAEQLGDEEEEDDDQEDTRDDHRPVGETHDGAEVAEEGTAQEGGEEDGQQVRHLSPEELDEEPADRAQHDEEPDPGPEDAEVD